MPTLTEPASEDDLYLARGADVEAYRPVFQGDIFKGVAIPGVQSVDELDLVLAISHPCEMRAGGKLAPSVQVIPVRTFEKVPFRKWPGGHYDKCPLPNLFPGEHHAAFFTETGMIPSASLALGNRVACLNDHGVLILQERYVHFLTRYGPPLDKLREVCAGVFTEVELLEDWNRELVPPREGQGEALDAALASEAAEFHAFLCAELPSDGSSLQDYLRDESKHGLVRQRVRKELQDRKERLEGSPGS